MFIDINLLPQRENENKTLLMLVITLIVLAIGGLFVAYFYTDSIDKKLDRVQNDLNHTREAIQLQQSKIKDHGKENSISKLEDAVKWAEDYPIKTVPVIKELTSLLPERGFIQTFTYDETGKASLTIQFDTSREAAFYLKNLLSSDWISEAFLENVETNELKMDEQDEDEGSTLEEETDKTAEGQSTVHGNENEMNKGNTETEDNKEDYLPRYLAQYRITLDKKYIKKQQNGKQAAESSAEGGEGS